MTVEAISHYYSINIESVCNINASSSLCYKTMIISTDVCPQL